LGRRKLGIDEVEILNMRREGKTVKEISDATGISTATLSRRIAELKYEKGVLTRYRELQGLQLTELQFRVLDAITPEKAEEASLLELVRAFVILDKSEAAIKGKESFKIKGLPDYLIELERLEKEASEER
jgi:DNA-binding Lrp family transcriptional regulator